MRCFLLRCAYVALSLGTLLGGAQALAQDDPINGYGSMVAAMEICLPKSDRPLIDEYRSCVSPGLDQGAFQNAVETFKKRIRAERDPKLCPVINGDVREKVVLTVESCRRVNEMLKKMAR